MPYPALMLVARAGNAGFSVTKHVWDGSTQDKTWSTAANWSTNQVPVSGDEVKFTSTDESVTLGLTQDTLHIDKFYIGPEYEGDIEGLVVSGIERLDIDKRHGRVDIEAGSQLRNVYIHNTAAGADPVDLKGTITNLYLYASRGPVTIKTGAVLDNVWVIPPDGKSAELVIEGGVTSVSALTIRAHAGAYIVSSSAIDELHIVGSAFVQTERAVTNFTLDGGVLNHQASASISGTNIIYAGTFSMVDNVSEPPVSIEGVTIYGGVMDLRNGLRSADH